MNDRTLKSFNILCVFFIILFAFLSVFIFYVTHNSTQTTRDFTIVEMEPQYEQNEKHENKYNTYTVTNNSNTDFQDCRLRVSLEDRYTYFMDYAYSDSFSISAGETKVINTHTFGEMEKETEVPNKIVYINKEKIVIGEEAE